MRETQNINLDNFFTGYNLNITIEELPSFAATSRKVSTKENISSNLDNMRQVNIRSDQNQNVDTIVVLREKDNSSLVAWGKANSAGMLPNISSEVLVETDERFTCLDAGFISKDMIVVDCVFRNSFGDLENLFFFVVSGGITCQSPSKVNPSLIRSIDNPSSGENTGSRSWPSRPPSAK